MALLVHKVTSATYFVIPDDYSSHHTNANTFTLQHYLNNTSKYFVSHNQFRFIYGDQYHINSVLIIKNINDFTITGPRISKCAAIFCTSPANIVVINATNIKFINIAVINCIRNHKDYLNITLFSVYYARDFIPFSKTTDYYTSLMLCNSSTVLHNITINTTTNTSYTAILSVNVKDSSMVNVKVQITPLYCVNFSNYPIEINGLKVFVYFYDQISKDGLLTINNFYYNNYKTCENNFLCVIVTIFLQNDRHDTENMFMLGIFHCLFTHLKDSRVLCSYGETMEGTKTQMKSNRYIIIRGSKFSDNSENINLNMFDIVFKHFKQPGYYILAQALSQIYYFDVWFSNCTFTRNTNMKTLINIRPPNTHTGVALITISLSTIYDNKNVTFIEVQWEFQTIHYRIIYISLHVVKVFSNQHHNPENFISIANGFLKFYSVSFKQNGYYDNIIYLQSSI